MKKITDFYSKLSHQEKMMLVVAFFFVMLAIMDRFVLGPILSQQKILEGEVGVKLQTIKRNQRIIAFKDSILKEYAKYRDYLDTGEKSKEEIVSALLREIETIAGQKSITISNIQPGDVHQNPIMDEYETSLECLGKLRNVLEFMQALEESDFLFQITKYSFAPKSKGSDIMKCSLSMSRIFITAEKIGTEKAGPVK